MTSPTKDQQLTCAVRLGRVEEARALLDAGVSPRLSVGEWKTPLLAEAKSGAMVRLLISYGADPNARSLRGTTPIFHCGNDETLKALLDAGADVNAVDNGGETAIFTDAGRWGGKLSSVKMLVKRGANTTLRNKGGQSLEDCTLAGVTAAGEMSNAKELIAWIKAYRGL